MNMIRDHAPAPEAPRAEGMFVRLDDQTLIHLVLQAVQEFDIAQPVPMSPGARAVNPSQITTLLVYCYARGIYGSEEIEARVPYDTAIAYISAGCKPDWHVLRRFRRDNSLLILGVLTRLMEIVAARLGLLRAPCVPQAWQESFRVQALVQLRDSIRTDCMVLDQ